MRFTSVSIAILSQRNNPSLLSPDFLARNGIVPETWKPEPQGILVLPPLARITYENGVEFMLQEEKFQIRANDPSRIEWAADLPRMTLAFLSTLPHVAYGAVGLNFEMREPAPTDDPKPPRLLDDMLKDGPWLVYGEECRTQTIRLQYRLPENIVLNLVINSLLAPTDDGPTEGYSFDANFNHDFEAGQVGERRSYVNTLAQRHEQLMVLLQRFSVGES